MTGEKNIYLIENKKTYETILEIDNKYEVPSFEQFMKTYEHDDNLNYEDLNSWDVGSSKGYGPCSSCSGSNRSLTFKLTIFLKNSRNQFRRKIVDNVESAREAASEISAKEGWWDDTNVSRYNEKERNSLISRINSTIDEHINGYKNINKVVENDIDWNDGKGICENQIM